MSDPASASQASHPRPKRVVLVDDSPLALAFVEEQLQSIGFEVRTFSDPREALVSIEADRPDVVLSDLDMPEMSGAELCTKLKAGPAHTVPVIILTANDRDGERVAGLRAGADDYVSKGASIDEISARIGSVGRRADETERMRKLFVRYTSDAVVEEILRRPHGVVLTGEKREATMLFADIRNFTTISEQLAPERVVALLNQVLGKLSAAVLGNGGTLDKFLGDGVMAIFGAPVTRADDALRAVQTAHQMMSAVKALSPLRETLPSGESISIDVDLGIGINSGQVIAGNLGSEQRTDYTCIGDAVNVASRLCSIAGPGEILIGERTRALCPDAATFVPLPPVKLKGKAHMTELYRLEWNP